MTTFEPSRRSLLAGGAAALLSGRLVAGRASEGRAYRLEEILPPSSFDNEDKAPANDARLAEAISEIAHNRGSIIGGGGKAIWLAHLDVTLTAPLSIELDQGTVLKGARGIARQIVVIRGGPKRHACRLKQVSFDSSLRDYVEVGAGGTALSLSGVDDWLLLNCHWYAGEAYRTDQPRGDNAVSTNGCGAGGVLGGTSKGICTTTFYFTRDPTDSGDGHHFVAKHQFIRCKTAASAKNEIALVSYTDNRVVECENGFGRVQTDLMGPALRMIARGNVLKKMGGFAFRSYGHGNDEVTGNLVEDWGRHYDGTRSEHRIAVNIRGAANCNYSKNKLRFADYDGSGCTAFSLGSRSFGGLRSDNKNNIVADNLIEGVEFGVRAERPADLPIGSNDFKHVKSAVSSRVDRERAPPQ